MAFVARILRRVISLIMARLFGVRHMRFKLGAFMARYSRYNAGSLDPSLLRIWQGLFPRHYFNNFSFHLQSRAIHLGFAK